jgi:hypothetical protein
VGRLGLVAVLRHDACGVVDVQHHLPRWASAAGSAPSLRAEPIGSRRQQGKERGGDRERGRQRERTTEREDDRERGRQRERTTEKEDDRERGRQREKTSEREDDRESGRQRPTERERTTPEAWSLN